MNIIDNVFAFFSKSTNQTSEKTIVQKQDEQVARLIAPVFREVPPNSKAGKFLTEGFRSWSFIAISAIADEISTTDIQLYKKQNNEWITLENHPALKLIEKPNAFQTKEEFFWLASVYWLSEGEAPIYLNSPKNPTEMVLLNPERINVVFDNKSIVGSYTYRQTNGTLTKIPAENVLMLKMPSVNSPFRGAGVMRYIAQTLDIDNYIEEYLKLFFFNDTTPGAVLETEQELSQSIIDRLKLQFTNRHQGVRNSHKLSILEKGMKYHKISSNINELQLKELNDLIRDKILAAFKVPKSVLGIVEDVNRANAEASSYTFSKRSVLPKLKMIEGQLNQFLLPKYNGGENLWFEFENPVFEDKLVDAQIYALGVQNGWLTTNEVREQIGLDPIDEMETDEMEDEPTQTDDDLDDDIDETDDEEFVGKYAKPKQKRTREKKRPDALTQIMKDILTDEHPEPKKFYSENELEKYHTDKIMFVDHMERDYSNDLKKNFRRQKRELLKQIEGKAVKSNSVNLQLDAEEELKQMIKISDPYLYEAVVKESGLAYELLGLRNTLTPTDDVVKNFVNSRTVQLGKETTKTTQDAIDGIVKNWAEKGGSWTDLRSELSDYFDGEGETGAKWRADMIARTELSNATGFAQNEVYRQTGAVGKQWLTAVDERVCEWCDDMNDKYGAGMIVGIDENFFDKGDELAVGGKVIEFGFDDIDTPPLHPNCRCDIIPVYAESKSNKPEIRKRQMEKVEQIRAEQKRLSEIEQREKQLNEKDMQLIEKEQHIAETEAMTKRNLSEVKKTRKQAEKELAEIEIYKDKINGKTK